MSSTREPPNANVRARLAAMVDLPSLGTALVMSNTFGRSASLGMNRTDERMLR
jgi:hypothetical protein